MTQIKRQPTGADRQLTRDFQKRIRLLQLYRNTPENVTSRQVARQALRSDSKVAQREITRMQRKSNRRNRRSNPAVEVSTG